MTSCKKGNLLDHVERVFEGKNSEHKKPFFLIKETYAFLLEINCKANQLFYIGHIVWPTYLFFHIGMVYFAIDI